MVQNKIQQITSKNFNFTIEAKNDICKILSNLKDKQSRYFILSKYLYDNNPEDILFFDMDELESHDIERSMEYLMEAYPDFHMYFFLLIRDSQYYLFDNDCNWLNGIDLIIKQKNSNNNNNNNNKNNKNNNSNDNNSNNDNNVVYQ
ncbi:hypothetical protein ACTFIV_010573 [Dictyostelium citrinum]